MDNPFLKKGIETIEVYRRNLSYSLYYINNSDEARTLDKETLEFFLKQAFPKLSWEISVAFQYVDHDNFWIDVKKRKYHLIDKDRIGNYEDLREQKRKELFDISKVEKEAKKVKGSKQKKFSDTFKKSDSFFKKFFKNPLLK